MKQRKLVIGLLIMLAVAVSGFTFAFWGSIQEDTTASGDITIGTGRTVTTTAVYSSQTAGVLVPNGLESESVEANAVSSITFTFNVDWDDNADYTAASDLTISTVSIENSNEVDVSALFNVAFPNPVIQLTPNAAAQAVTITITMNEPADQAAYDLVAGLAITFTFNFSVDAPANA